LEKVMAARLAVAAADAVPLDPLVPAGAVELLDELEPLDGLGLLDGLELLDGLGLLDGVVPADAAGGTLAFTLVLWGVAAAASVWAATLVAPGATPTATGAGETPIGASPVVRGGEVEPLAPTAAAVCDVRVGPVSAASTRLEWSPDRVVIVRAPGAPVPSVSGLALEAASAGGPEAWPSPLTDPRVTELDDGVLASTPLDWGGVKSDRANPGLVPAIAFDETASVDRESNLPISMPTPEATTLPHPNPVPDARLPGASSAPFVESSAKLFSGDAVAW
jgi:hypothetical protein